MEWRVFNDQTNFQARFSGRTQIITLAGFTGLCLLVGLSAAMATLGSVHGWYALLHAPPLTPPNGLFGPVWGLLYVMMAVAAWMVWREADVRWLHYRALQSWGWQLGINALWPPVFFSAHLLLPGLFVMMLLFAVVAYTIYRFWQLQRVAAWLLAPYLAWVGFALYLNAGFWWLNH